MIKIGLTVSCRVSVCCGNIPEKSEWHDGQGRINVPSFRRSYSRGCVNRIRLWPLRRDDHSCVLIGAGGPRRSDWPERVKAVDVRARSLR